MTKADEVCAFILGFKQAALKCAYCGDIRQTYWPGDCSGVEKYKATDQYKEYLSMDGAYSAMRYFEKRICNPSEMEQDELLDYIADKVRKILTD